MKIYKEWIKMIQLFLRIFFFFNNGKFRQIRQINRNTDAQLIHFILEFDKSDVLEVPGLPPV